MPLLTLREAKSPIVPETALLKEWSVSKARLEPETLPLTVAAAFLKQRLPFPLTLPLIVPPKLIRPPLRFNVPCFLSAEFETKTSPASATFNVALFKLIEPSAPISFSVPEILMVASVILILFFVCVPTLRRSSMLSISAWPCILITVSAPEISKSPAADHKDASLVEVPFNVIFPPVIFIFPPNAAMVVEFKLTVPPLISTFPLAMRDITSPSPLPVYEVVIVPSEILILPPRVLIELASFKLISPPLMVISPLEVSISVLPFIVILPPLIVTLLEVSSGKYKPPLFCNSRLPPVMLKPFLTKISALFILTLPPLISAFSLTVIVEK